MIRNLAAALAGAACIAAISTPASAETREYHIEAGNLKSALDLYARQSGRQIIYKSDEVKASTSPGVRGRLSPDAALQILLKGTGFTAVSDPSGAVAIVRAGQASNEQIPPDSVSDSETGQLLPAAGSAITVTGTRIRGVGSASAVTVTTRRSLEEAGISDLAQFTRVLPQNFTGGQNRGIAGGGEQGGQDNVNDSATLNLRGLGPDATLTLLDGHRLSYDAVDQGVDISAIPLNAVDRIEVVADGASALYGSDAVAGVVNIILRRDYEGLETTGRVGGSTSGGNFQQQLSLVGGHRWNSGGFMIALDENSATPITAADRDYTRGNDPSFFLTDRIRQQSGVLTAHQQLAPSLTFDLDGYLMKRKTRWQNPFSNTQDVSVYGNANDGGVLSWAVTPTLRADLGGWQASLSATDGVSRTTQRNDIHFPGTARIGHSVYQDYLKGVETTAEGPLFALPGGDARLAVGGGLRRIALHSRFDVSVNGGPWSTVENFTERRKTQFAYGEVSLPLASPDLQIPMLTRLTLTGAIRYEHWDQIASVTTPKFGVIYQPHPDVTLRGTWGKSFKIPTLIQVNELDEADLIPGIYFEPAPANGGPVLLVEGNVPDLKPERATTWSGTIEFSPHAVRGLQLRATYFNIDYRDRIAPPIHGSTTALNNPLYSDLVILNPTAAQVNAAIDATAVGLVNQTGEPFDPSAVGAIINAATRNTAANPRCRPQCRLPG